MTNPIIDILDSDSVDEYVFYSLFKRTMSQPIVSAYCLTLKDVMTQEEFEEFCSSQGYTVEEITPEDARTLTSEHDAHIKGHFYRGEDGMEFHQIK